jgi:chromosome segregation ATPase
VTAELDIQTQAMQRLQSDYELLTNQHKNVKMELNNTEHQLSQVKQSIITLEQKNSSLESQVISLQQQRNVANIELNNLKLELNEMTQLTLDEQDKAKSAAEKQCHTITLLESNLRQLEIEIGNKKTEISGNIKNIEEIKLNDEQNNQILMEKQKIIATLQQTLENHEKKYMELNDSYSAKQAEFLLAIENSLKYESQAELLSQQLAQAKNLNENKLLSLQADISRLTAENEIHNKARRQSEAAVVQLRQQLELYQAQSVAEINSKQLQLVEQLNKLRQECEQMKGEKLAAEGVREELKRQLNLARTAQQAEEKSRQTTDQQWELRHDNLTAEYKQKYNELGSNLANSRAEIDQLQSQLKLLRRQLDASGKSLQSTQAQDLKEITQLKAKLNIKNKTNAALEAELAAAKAELDSLKKLAEQLKINLNKHSESRDKAKARVKELLQKLAEERRNWENEKKELKAKSAAAKALQPAPHQQVSEARKFATRYQINKSNEKVAKLANSSIKTEQNFANSLSNFQNSDMWKALSATVEPDQGLGQEPGEKQAKGGNKIRVAKQNQHNIPVRTNADLDAALAAHNARHAASKPAVPKPRSSFKQLMSKVTSAFGGNNEGENTRSASPSQGEQRDSSNSVSIMKREVPSLEAELPNLLTLPAPTFLVTPVDQFILTQVFDMLVKQW